MVYNCTYHKAGKLDKVFNLTFNLPIVKLISVIINFRKMS